MLLHFPIITPLIIYELHFRNTFAEYKKVQLGLLVIIIPLIIY